MSVSYPVSLDSLTNPSAANNLNTVGVVHHTQHSDVNDICKALEAKVGIDGSAVTTTHDYKLSAVTGTDKAVTSSDSRLTDSRAASSINLGVATVTGTLPNANTAALTGDVTKTAGANSTVVAAIAGVTPSAFFLTVVDDANAGAMRTTLGLGTLATQSGTFSGTSSGTNTGDQTISDATISVTDIATNNASASAHGFLPKLSNLVTDVLRGDGTYGPPESPNALITIDEDFLGGAMGVINTRSSGTGAAATVISNAAFLGHDGVISLATGSTTTGFSALGAITGSNAQAALVLSDGAVIFEWDIYIPVLSAAADIYTIRCGLIDANNGESVDGVFFRYTHGTNSGKFEYVTRSNSSETAADSGTTVAAVTWYKLRGEVNAAGTSVTFYINGSSVGTTTTNIPTGTARYTGFGAMILKAGGSVGTTSCLLDVDYVYLRKVLTTPR